MSKRTKDIINMRKNRYKFREIGLKWGITRQRAYQIYKSVGDNSKDKPEKPSKTEGL